MNRKIGMWSAIVNIGAVAGFALSMLLGSNFGSYATSMFIALSFIPMICAFVAYAKKGKKTAAYAGMIFAGMYALCNLIVYFTQLTAVRLDNLQGQALQILDFQNFGLIFSYDLMGYGLMALATFFIGLTIIVKRGRDKWLKWLLLIHGVFAIGCFLLPILGVFSSTMAGVEWIGTAVLEFWCLYFIPVGILSFLYFKDKK